MSNERVFPNRDTPGADGSVRKAHYGEGEQPWDTMLRLGWAIPFAAGCVLRYLRRDKDPAHSLESARWYYQQLYRLAADNYLPLRLSTAEISEAQIVFRTLNDELTEEEKKRLSEFVQLKG